MALGAKGTYIGRAMLYGLGAMGEAGVTRALQIIHKELDLYDGLLRAHRCREGGCQGGAGVASYAVLGNWRTGLSENSYESRAPTTFPVHTGHDVRLVAFNREQNNG